MDWESDRGTRLIVGVWLQAAGGAVFVLFGLYSIVSSRTHLGKLTPAMVEDSDPRLIEHLAHTQFLVAVFACTLGVGMAAIALFGVRNGQWWAWVTGVLGCSVLVAVMITMLASSHTDSPLEAGTIMTVAALHALGSVLTRPYLR